VNRILIVEMTRLGDLTAASALIAPLQKAFPGAQLSLAGALGYAPLYDGSAARFEGFAPTGWAFLRQAWASRKSRQDPGLLIVVASPAVRNSLLLLLSRPGRACGYLFPRAGALLGYDAPAPLQALGGGWASQRLPPPHLHMVERAAQALSIAGIACEGMRPSLAGGGQGKAKRVVLHAGAQWDRRRWPLERFVELGGRLAADGCECILVPAEAGLPASLPPGLRVESGLDLQAFKELLASAALFVGNDSGPLHLAAALGVPCLALFGPNRPERSGPWPLPGAPGSPHRALYEALPCSPCDQVLCVQPWDWCMARLQADQAHAEATAMLAGPSR
jgi:hypothetical protein